MPKPPQKPLPDLAAEFRRTIADPSNKTPSVLGVRALRSMAAEGSTGRVSATLNGYDALKRVRIATEMYSDLPRLGRLVRRAVNLAINEVDRRVPPIRSPSDPLEPIYIPLPRPPTDAHRGGAVTSADVGSSRVNLPGATEAQRNAYIDGAHIVRERIMRDALIVEGELTDLLTVVYHRLSMPRLHAAYVRRAANSHDPSTLEWFRIELGVSLTEYIRRRRIGTAARMIYRSDLTLEEIAQMFDFRTGHAISSAIKRWCGRTPKYLRYVWEHMGLDYVLLKWALAGMATIGQIKQVDGDLRRLIERLKTGAPINALS